MSPTRVPGAGSSVHGGLSRRTLLGMFGAAAMAGVGVPLLGGLGGASSTGTLLVSQRPLPRPFTRALSIPPELMPTDRTATADVYEITQRPADVALLDDVRTPIWGYNGMFPGPTIVARRGRQVRVRHRNELPVPVALAVLPAGTGNLVAANLGLPTSLAEGVATAARGRRRLIDLGCLDGHHFALMAGMGFDAAMMQATPQWWKQRVGWPAYVVGGLRRVFDPAMRVRIALDDRPPITRTARVVLVANLGRMQGGVDLFGDAAPDDGQLDVAVVAPRGPADWLTLATRLILRRTPPRRQVETFQASTVDIRSRTVQPRQIDGDLIAAGDRLTITIRPGALWVCVP